MNTRSYLSEYINDKYILKLLFLCTLFPPRGLFFPCFVFPLNLFHTRAVPSSDVSCSVVCAWWRRGPSRVYCRLPAGARGWSAHICLRPLGAGGLLFAYPRDGIFWSFLLFAYVTWMVLCPLIHIFQKINLQTSAEVWGGRPPQRERRGGVEMQLLSSSPAPPRPAVNPTPRSRSRLPALLEGSVVETRPPLCCPHHRLVTEPPPACQLLITLIAVFQSCAAVVCSPVLSPRACPFLFKLW